MAHTSAAPRNINQRFLAIAADPRIIPGVHHYCDEWCDYCALRPRCLAFRCTEDFRKQHRRPPHEPPFRSIEELVQFTRDIAAIEGTPTDELDALVASGAPRPELSTTDPLANLAAAYANDVAAFLMEVEAPAPSCAEDDLPPPLLVVVWFHVRVYLRLTRALVSHALTETGTLDRREDSLGCAKASLEAVQRSRAALLKLPPVPSHDVSALIDLLDRIEHGIHERFPAANVFIRVGLDVPVA